MPRANSGSIAEETIAELALEIKKPQGGETDPIHKRDIEITGSFAFGWGAGEREA